MLLIFQGLIMTEPPTPPYTEATVELVARVLEPLAKRGPSHDPSRCLSCRVDAKLVLDALAAAGLLLPEGAETRIEYGLRRGDSVAAYKSRADAEMWQNWSTPGWELVSHTVAETPWDAVGGGEADQSNARDLRISADADQSKEQA